MTALLVTPNHSARTFTIRESGSKYRTPRLLKFEFEELLHNTEGDWLAYLKSNEVIVIK